MQESDPLNALAQPVSTQPKVYVPPSRFSPTILVIFCFYYLITTEIYFNTERPLRSATVNSKSVLVSLSSRSFFQFLLALSPLTSQSLTCSLK